MHTRLDRLTALRWVAALLVFGCHLNLVVLQVGRLGRLTSQGVAGVDFFFVLSGFVLAWSHRPGDSARPFYRRRAARILPLYLLAWLAGALASPLLHGSSLAQQLPSLFLVQAWVPSFPIYFAGATVLWSLSCELLFYLVFPLLIGPIVRARDTSLLRLAGAMAVLAILVPVALHPADSDEGWRYWLIYPFPVTRLCEFVLGAAAAVLVSRGALPRVRLVPALLLASVVYLASGWTPEWVQPVAAPVVPFALVIVAAAQSDLEGATRPPRWLVRLGEWSFAFYLFQLTILRVVMHWAGNPGLGARVVLSVVLFGVCLGAAAVLCELVEKPVERRLRRDRSLPVSLASAPGN